MSTKLPQKKIIQAPSEPDIHYKSSPLTHDNAIGNGPKAGDRTPNALVVKLPWKETTSLFSILHSKRWNMLLFTGTDEPKADAKTGLTDDMYQQLADVSARLEAKYEQIIANHMIIANSVPPADLPWVRSTVMDTEHLLHTKYGMNQPGIYLLRPDGYIAFRGSLITRNSSLPT